MTISTYSELKDAVALWTNRADLATGGANVSRVDEIIDNAEALLNRELRVTDQETKSASFSITGEYVAVPADFLQVRSFYLNTTAKATLTFLPPDTQTDYYGSAGSGQPKFFSVVGTNFRFSPVPDATYTATLVYFAKIPALSVSNTTNWLLTSHPDLYLAACRAYAYDFIRDSQAMGEQMKLVELLSSSLKRQGDMARWGGNSMAVRVR